MLTAEQHEVSMQKSMITVCCKKWLHVLKAEEVSPALDTQSLSAKN